jgi:hypothetical protein
MILRYRVALFLLLATAGLANGQGTYNALSPAERAAGWILLWDGKATAGWEPAAAFDMEASEGALRQAKGAYMWLRSKTTYADFVLAIDFRIMSDDADSGVFIRAAKDGDATRTGYQVNINNLNKEYSTGSVVNRAKYSAVTIKAGEWHHYEITASGGHITVALDGKQTAELRDDGSRSGHIGFQLVKPLEVEFRNVRLKPLSAGASH